MAAPATVDEGPRPVVLDIESATLDNTNYRTTVWTGTHLQVTVMSIPPGEDIGLEIHHDRDQFLRVERGHARVQIGPGAEELTFDREIRDDWVVLVPAGNWHNITNLGREPLQLYALYGPPEHEHGAVHPTKADALEEEG